MGKVRRRYYLAFDGIVKLVNKRLRKAKKASEEFAPVHRVKEVGVDKAAEEDLFHCDRTR